MSFIVETAMGWFWRFVEANLDKPWNWGYLSANPMDRPYYSSSVHKRKLPDTCGEELARVCLPSRLAQWMAGEPGMEGLV